MVYISGVTMGCTSPISVVSNVLIGIADTIVGLLLAQLVRKGTPFVVSKFGNTMDMKTMTVENGRPEQILSHIACADVFRYLGLPFSSNMGDTDSGILDATAVFNGAIGISTGAYAGITMVMGMGGYEQCLVADYVDALYGNEIAGYMQHMMADLEITEDTLLLDEIEEIGPGGNFITAESTLDFCRSYWQPDVLQAVTRETYRQPDTQSMEEKYREKARAILAAGPKYPLSNEKLAALDRLMEAAEKAAAKAEAEK